MRVPSGAGGATLLCDQGRCAMDVVRMPRLTLREHRATWMLSQGTDVEVIARKLGIRTHSVSQMLNRARLKTGTPNRYAYLAYAVLNGIIGPELDCGKSVTAYKRHHARDEPVCPACRRFHDRFNARTYDCSDLPQVEIILTPREFEVLDAIASGADSMQQIGDKIGLGRKRVASHLSVLYEKLGVPDRDNRDRRRIVLYVARQRGVFPMPDGTYRTAAGRSVIPPQMRLSPKQIDLLRACEDGSPLRVVGERCGIPREAASARLSEIYRRLGVGGRGLRGNEVRRNRRLEAVRRARDFGLMD